MSAITVNLGGKPVSVPSAVAKQLELKPGQIITCQDWVRVIKAATADSIEFVERPLPVSRGKNGIASPVNRRGAHRGMGRT